MIDFENFEKLLVANWTLVLDRSKFMARVIQDARDGDSYEFVQGDHPPACVKLNVTKFELFNNWFEIWAEFMVPVEHWVVVGTHVYRLRFDGQLGLLSTSGVMFSNQN